MRLKVTNSLGETYVLEHVVSFTLKGAWLEVKQMGGRSLQRGEVVGIEVDVEPAVRQAMLRQQAK